MLIGSGRSGCDGIVAQQGVQVLAFLFGQAGQDAPGPGRGGQDAFHGSQGIGAEAHRPLQGGQPIRTFIAGQQRQDVLGLVFALTLRGPAGHRGSGPPRAPGRGSVP